MPSSASEAIRPALGARVLRARVRWALLALAAVVGPIPASAQTAGTPPEAESPTAGTDGGSAEPSGGARAAPPKDVEVIRIKGRSVTGIQTEVPASVQSFTAADLTALGAQNVSDIAKVTPNVEIKTSGSTSPTFFIRGVGLSDFSANAEGAVAIYRDEVAIRAPALQLTPLFDLENIEVLRGPQGTGSGRNSSAGAIKMYSRKPTGDLGAELRTSFGNYDARDYEGAIEAPVIDETLATRLSFRFTTRGPTTENRCGGIGYPSLAQQPVTSTTDPRLPDPPPSPLPPGFVGNDKKSFCGETPIQTQTVTNPRFTPPLIRSPSPPHDAQGDPFQVRISTPQILDGKADPTGVNDLGDWAARGIFRFDPPWVDDMDWTLNLHGSKTDQLSTLGQAMGTIGNPNQLGGTISPGGGGYQEQDQAAELQRIVAARTGNPNALASTANKSDREKLAKRLANGLDDNPFAGDYNRVGNTTLDTWGAALRGEWSLGSMTLTSVSGVDQYWRFRDTDQDFTPEVLFESVAEDQAWQFFQEATLHGELGELPVKWDLGGYYLQEHLIFHDQTFTLGGNSSRPILRDYIQDIESWAVYAGFSWEFLDDFTLEGGVRWNQDHKEMDFTVQNTRFASPPTRSFLPADASAPTGGLTLTYRFAEDVSSYWKYTRGWKPGTFNTVAQQCSGGACDVTQANPETIDAWETGLAGSWLDGRVSARGALFYYMYRDYQVFVVSTTPSAAPTLKIVNANEAQVYGAEVDMRVEPLVDLVPAPFEGLVVSWTAGWLQSQFLDFAQVLERQITSGPTTQIDVDYSGNPLINSPRFKMAGSAEWTFDLGRFGALVPRYDFAWTADIAFDPNRGRGNPDAVGTIFLPNLAVGQPRFWLHNIRLAYRLPEGNIEIAGWCRNLTNQVYKTYGFDASAFANVVLNFVGEPRTYGLDFIVRF